MPVSLSMVQLDATPPAHVQVSAGHLLSSFGRIGLVGFGGGQAMLPLVEAECVGRAQWLSETEFLDLVALPTLLPGPLAVKVALLVGLRVGGPLGSLAALLGMIGPCCVLCVALGAAYNRHQAQPLLQQAMASARPVVFALLGWALCGMRAKALPDAKSVAVAAVAFSALAQGVAPHTVLLAALSLGVATHFLLAQ